MQGNLSESKGLSLLKKGQKGIVHAVFSRMGLFILLLIVQIGVLFSAFQWFENLLPHLFGGTILFTSGMVLYLLNSQIDSTAKNTWLVVVMLLPMFGALLYWYTQSDLGHRAVKARIEQIIGQTSNLLPQDKTALKKLQAKAPGAAALARYVDRNSCQPVYENTSVIYFPLGENKWAEMLRQLECAEHFIFMEYFIIDVWMNLLVLKKKPGFVPLMFISLPCAQSFPAAQASKFPPCTAWAIRRYCYEKGPADKCQQSQLKDLYCSVFCH